MKKYKIVLIIICIIVIICIVVGPIIKKDITIPDDAEYVGKIVQSKIQSSYMDSYYEYIFYNANGKNIYQKVKQTDVGITCQYIEPEVMTIGYIRNKKDMEKIKNEIENNKQEYENVKIYYNSSNGVTSIDDFINYLQLK